MLQKRICCAALLRAPVGNGSSFSSPTHPRCPFCSTTGRLLWHEFDASQQQQQQQRKRLEHVPQTTASAARRQIAAAAEAYRSAATTAAAARAAQLERQRQQQQQQQQQLHQQQLLVQEAESQLSDLPSDPVVARRALAEGNAAAPAPAPGGTGPATPTPPTGSGQAADGLLQQKLENLDQQYSDTSASLQDKLDALNQLFMTMLVNVAARGDVARMNQLQQEYAAQAAAIEARMAALDAAAKSAGERLFQVRQGRWAGLWMRRLRVVGRAAPAAPCLCTCDPKMHLLTPMQSYGIPVKSNLTSPAGQQQQQQPGAT